MQYKVQLVMMMLGIRILHFDNGNIPKESQNTQNPTLTT